MILTIIIGIIIAVCLVSTLIVYVLIRSHENLKSSPEKHQVKYSFRPSFATITKKITKDFSFPSNLSSDKSNRSSLTINSYEESHLKPKNKQTSIPSISPLSTPIRSSSLVSSLFHQHHSRTSNWRQGSIVDPNQMALIQFSLPINPKENKYRRRSVPVCNNIIPLREHPLTTINSTRPSLLSFSMIYLKNSQIRIQFNSLQALPAHVQLQQLIIKVKLFPDGKEKSIQIRKFIQNEIIFGDENNEIFVLFSNISYEKVHEKSLLITIHGKDQTKKSLNLGHIGKIHFNQINQLENENPVDFIHEIEKIKPSSIELLVYLQKKDDQHIHVDIQRIKGLKIDQKNLVNATCYLQILLLDHHRPLITKQTKFYRLNSSNLILGEQYDLNILSYNSNNLDRLMIMVNLYSNCNHSNEFKCIGHVKLASPLFCSGSGTIHWQQFKTRDSFSMWHTLNKPQH